MSSEADVLPAYDRDLAIGIAGGNAAIASELLSLFLQELPPQTVELHRAWCMGNLEQLRQITHKLRGSASYCGTPALREAAQNLESVLLQMQTEMIPGAYARLLGEIERLLDDQEAGIHRSC